MHRKRRKKSYRYTKEIIKYTYFNNHRYENIWKITGVKFKIIYSSKPKMRTLRAHVRSTYILSVERLDTGLTEKRVCDEIKLTKRGRVLHKIHLRNVLSVHVQPFLLLMFPSIYFSSNNVREIPLRYNRALKNNRRLEKNHYLQLLCIIFLRWTVPLFFGYLRKGIVQKCI